VVEELTASQEGLLSMGSVSYVELQINY